MTVLTAVKCRFFMGNKPKKPTKLVTRIAAVKLLAPMLSVGKQNAKLKTQNSLINIF